MYVASTDSGICMRPPLNKKSFPFHRPGGLKRAFFPIFFNFLFCLLTPPPLYNLVYKNEIMEKIMFCEFI